MTKHRNNWRMSLCATVAVAIVAGESHAAIIQQQAEAADTIGSNYTAVADAASSGGVYLNPTGVAFDGETNADSQVQFVLNFPEAGDYDLLVRFRIAADGSSDSFFISSDFGIDPDDDQRELYEGGPNYDPVPVLEGGAFGDYSSGDFVWVNMTASVQEDLDPGSAFLGGSSEVGTYSVAAPGVLTYEIGGRENNLGIDAIAFANEPVAVAADGTLIPVPEPAAVLLMSLACVALAARKRP